jgi:serine protease DegS
MSVGAHLPILGLAALAAGAAFVVQASGGAPEPEAAPAAQQQAAPAAGVLAALDAELRAIAERTRRSIVTVAAYVREEGADAEVDVATPAWVRQPDRDYPGYRRIGAGSGIVVGAGGEIVTNRHLLLRPDGTPADLVDVETADLRHTLSCIVGMEPTLNLAVVRLEVYSQANPPDFAPIEIGDSDALAQGALALPVGDPFGPERFFALGVVAGTPNRQCYQEQLTATYLQVAAVVHPGAYGGGVLDARGRLVGMLTPREPALGVAAPPDAIGLAFALPSNVLTGIYATILETESVRSPWLGFAVMGIAELRRELGTAAFGALQRPRFGIYVENVFTPSPAADAGVQVGDFLTHLDGQAIGTPLDFQRCLYLAGIGRKVELRLFRAGEEHAVAAVVEQRPEEAVTR